MPCFGFASGSCLCFNITPASTQEHNMLESSLLSHSQNVKNGDPVQKDRHWAPLLDESPLLSWLGLLSALPPGFLNCTHEMVSDCLSKVTLRASRIQTSHSQPVACRGKKMCHSCCSLTSRASEEPLVASVMRLSNSNLRQLVHMTILRSSKLTEASS